MDTYSTTRANERARQSVVRQLKRFLRKSGCTSHAKRRAAYDRGASVALREVSDMGVKR